VFHSCGQPAAISAITNLCVVNYLLATVFMLVITVFQKNNKEIYAPNHTANDDVK